MKPKVIRNMVAISKYDKKVWENYVSNLENYVLFKQKDSFINTKRNNKSINSPKKYNKKNIEPEMLLDLHGHTLYSAKLLLNKFISSCYEKNIRNVLIITGKGRNNKGVLRDEVPQWLSDKFLNKFLVIFDVAPSHFGGTGALLVRIKNRFKKN